MKAIEINSKTDKEGYLRINYNIQKSNSDVRVLILIDNHEVEIIEEELWLDSISKNPTFDFLKDPYEDIYSINDGEPIND